MYPYVRCCTCNNSLGEYVELYEVLKNYLYDIELKNPLFRFLGGFLIGWYAMRFWEHAVIDKLKKIFH